MASVSFGGATPASSQAVGMKSQNAQTRSDVAPPRITPVSRQLRGRPTPRLLEG